MESDKLFDPRDCESGNYRVGAYGGIDTPTLHLHAPKAGLHPPRRRRLHFLPMVWNTLLPWALFLLTYSAAESRLNYSDPLVCNVVLGTGLLMVLATFLAFISTRAMKGGIFVSVEREPSWILFLAVSLLAAWLTGYVAGSFSFASMQDYYEMDRLHNYTNIDPTVSRGVQLMDAGVIAFVPGTKLEISKSIGFQNGEVFCVAPITFGDVPSVTLDFWAVGKDCCSAGGGDFRCAGFGNPRAHGGRRVLDSRQETFYRLAVQKAEAGFGVTATHPLFFTWEVESSASLNKLLLSATTDFRAWMVIYLIFQIFLVLMAVAVFSRIP
mmetsp:Transcript_85422/g.153800  ORF Transcript_85422/g.153800 Transcript_85422/m.153800 type:complete len:325 (+) Transcript_85422:99-1073(+)